MQLSYATDSVEFISVHRYSFHIYENMMKRAYPLTDPPAFTLPLKFPWFFFNPLMSPSRTILIAWDFSFMKFHSIFLNASIITLEYLVSLSL